MKIDWDQVITAEQKAEMEKPPLVPLTPRQLLIAAFSIGLTENDIVANLEAIQDPDQKYIAMTEWNKATQFERDHFLVEDLRQNIGLEKEQFDDLWRWARTL